MAFPSLSGQQASFSSSACALVQRRRDCSQAVLQDLVQCSVVLATELRVQRSDSSKRSPAVAKHLPFLDVRLVPCHESDRTPRAKGFKSLHADR